MTSPTSPGRTTTSGTSVRDSGLLLQHTRTLNSAEPIESELATQVEYDMDEQGQPLGRTSTRRALVIASRALTGPLADKEWLDAVNLERKKEQSGTISYETFEIIMDQLEKEWFKLVSPVRPVK